MIVEKCKGRRKKMSTAEKKLFRSRNNRMIGGVCAGIGDFFGIDPTIVRLLFVFSVIFGYGITVLLYLVLFIVVPEAPQNAVEVIAAPQPVDASNVE
jgi:phage shock protein C